MDNERKGLWLGGQPYWLAIICCLLCLIPMYIPKGEGMVQTTDMTGTLAICFGLAVILNEIGERIPIWNTYIGGGLLLTFFGVAILRQFGLIPQAGLDAINSFISDDANFLTFFIVIAPIMQGRIPSICSEVTTVTTPGEDVDVVVTDYGIAINPKRTDLIEATKDTGLPIKTIEELRDIAYAIVGTPDKVQFGDRVVGIIEARDGTIMDVVRAVKEYEFAD